MALNGTSGGSLYQSLHSVGTAVVVGTSASALSTGTHSTGIATLSGTSASDLSMAAYSADLIGRIGGTSRSALAMDTFSRGYQPIQGHSAGDLLMSMSSERPILFGVSGSGLTLEGLSTGHITVTGTSRSVLSMAISSRGLLVETDDGVWVVNLATGGHSRYTGDLTGATPVAAYALTGVDQLGSDRAKYVHEVFTHARMDGEAQISTIVDEQKTPTPYTVAYDGREGIHRRRTKTAKGLKGTNWQIKIANVDGSNVTVKSVEVPPIASQRVR